MYKEAIINKFRFETSVGMITTEDLFDLTLKQLDSIASKLRSEIEASEKSSLFETKSTNTIAKQKYEIVADVFRTKREIAAEAEEAARKKQKKARIRELIAKKQEAALENLEITELEKLLEE